jgi:hypothetical protein
VEGEVDLAPPLALPLTPGLTAVVWEERDRCLEVMLGGRDCSWHWGTGWGVRRRRTISEKRPGWKEEGPVEMGMRMLRFRCDSIYVCALLGSCRRRWPDDGLGPKSRW